MSVVSYLSKGFISCNNHFVEALIIYFILIIVSVTIIIICLFIAPRQQIEKYGSVWQWIKEIPWLHKCLYVFLPSIVATSLFAFGVVNFYSFAKLQYLEQHNNFIVETLNVNSEVDFEESEYRDNILGYRIIICNSSHRTQTNTFISQNDVDLIGHYPYMRLYYVMDDFGHIFVSKIELLSNSAP